MLVKPTNKRNQGVRVYQNFKEAKNEIKRDLNELGTEVFAGYQSKQVDREAFTTKELQNYDYRVLQPRLVDLEPPVPEWVDAEWCERLEGIEGRPVNPGEAYKLRRELWDDLMEGDRFAYTYSERFALAEVPLMIRKFRQNLESRQIYVSIWFPDVDVQNIGVKRVPCTLGYHFMLRNGRLDITYYMRSSDFSTHFDNDCFLAIRLQEYVAWKLEVPLGNFTHVINSLHVYAKDVAGTF